MFRFILMACSRSVRSFARLIAHLSSLDDGIKTSTESFSNNQTGGSLCAAKISYPF